MRKEILLYDKSGGFLSRQQTWLKELAGFRCTRFEDPHTIADMLRGAPPYALIGINSLILEERESRRQADKAILEALALSSPKVPLLWIGDRERDAPQLAVKRPNISFFRPISPRTLRFELSRLLKEHFFPPDITRVFVDAIHVGLWESFALRVRRHDDFLKADALSLGPVSAMVAFLGQGAQGCVTVSGPERFFIRAHKRILPSAQYVDAANVAGEICNVITGTFKSFLVSYTNLQHSFPIIVHGHPLSLSYGGPGRLSLVQAVTDEEDQVYVELCLDHLDRTQLERDDVRDDYDSSKRPALPGELCFF